MSKDWNGNKASTFKCLGASNHTDHEREERDYYATDPLAAYLLLNVESDLNNIWEPAVGERHLSQVFASKGKIGRESDIVNRLDGTTIEELDFLSVPDNYVWDGDIVTNPPYKYAEEFVRKSLNIVPDGRKVCMFLKLTFCEGKSRKKLFEEFPPKTIYVSSSRITCAMNGQFYKNDEKTGKLTKQSSAVCYAWFVWEKGYKGSTILKWIN